MIAVLRACRPPLGAEPLLLVRMLAVAFALIARGPAAATAQDTDPFGHARHAGLFPLCTGCHVMDGNRVNAYPAPAQCAGCHDGRDLALVDWSAPPAQPTLLDFDHPAHARAMQGVALTCEGCHVAPGRERMDVQSRTEAGNCLSCHTPESAEHFSRPDCSTCHIPLAESSLPLAQISELPAPATHTAPSFLAEHEGGASCAICHTRERCAICHVNASTLEAVQAIPAAPGSLILPRYEAEYPEPPGHDVQRWMEDHGTAAATPASCSTCHTSESCTSCHSQPAPDAVDALPSTRVTEAQGVASSRRAPESHEDVRFTVAHGPSAATRPAACEACHTRTTCTSCHSSAVEPIFHPNGFMERHATAAFGRRLECSNCHDSEIFCADCHRSAGRAPEGRTGAAYHDAEPVWLLRHGQAARQGMESCTACHRQQDCLRCHSQLGAFRVNPHGPGFDAEQAHRRNPFVCRACHITDPIRGGGG
jgi:hypothetical protein